jgi:hypothetical protein
MLPNAMRISGSQQLLHVEDAEGAMTAVLAPGCH